METPVLQTPFSGRLRRALLRANLLAVIALAIAIFGMINYLSIRHYARVHWSRSAFARMSAATGRLLDNVAADVRVVALLRPTHAAYRGTAALLQEYADRSPSVSSNSSIRTATRAHRSARAAIRPGRAECVVFDVAAGTRPCPPRISSNTAIRRTPTKIRPGLRGEPLFGSALYALTQATRPAFASCRDTASVRPTISTGARLFAHRRAPAQPQRRRRRLEFGETKAVPNRCALMVVAAPPGNSRRSRSPCRAIISTARAACCCSSTPGRRPAWNPCCRTGASCWATTSCWTTPAPSAVANARVRVCAARHHAPLQDLASVFSCPVPSAPAVRRRADKRPSCRWPPLRPPLAEFDPTILRAFRSAGGRSRPVPVAVAVERGPCRRARADPAHPPGGRRRFRFRVQWRPDGANADLFLNAANWLLDAATAVRAAGRRVRGVRLVMNARQLGQLFWIAAIALPGLVAAAGLAMRGGGDARHEFPPTASSRSSPLSSAS
jgi:hypothetical protein